MRTGGISKNCRSRPVDSSMARPERRTFRPLDLTHLVLTASGSGSPGLYDEIAGRTITIGLRHLATAIGYTIASSRFACRLKDPAGLRQSQAAPTGAEISYVDRSASSAASRTETSGTLNRQSARKRSVRRPIYSSSCHADEQDHEKNGDENESGWKGLRAEGPERPVSGRRLSFRHFRVLSSFCVLNRGSGPGR